MIATQLHRENINIDTLYKTASLYCKPTIVKSFFNKKRESITFILPDSSKLRIKRGTCGSLIRAGVEA